MHGRSSRAWRAAEPVGPLAGVPVAIKDLIFTKGLRTTFGSRLYADFVPDDDDIVVERLRAAGAVIIGKTNAAEFGYSGVRPQPAASRRRAIPGTSRGPRADRAPARPPRSPPESCPLALGSDGGGSVRLPAAFTGIVGIKPPWGACRCGRAAATSAGPAPRAGNRSSISARSPAPSPTRRSSLAGHRRSPIARPLLASRRAASAGERRRGGSAETPRIAWVPAWADLAVDPKCWR